VTGDGRGLQPRAARRIRDLGSEGAGLEVGGFSSLPQLSAPAGQGSTGSEAQGPRLRRAAKGTAPKESALAGTVQDGDGASGAATVLLRNLDKRVRRLVADGMVDHPDEAKAARTPRRVAASRSDSADRSQFADLVLHTAPSSKGSESSAWTGQEAEARASGHEGRALEAAAAPFGADAAAPDAARETQAPSMHGPAAPAVDMPELDPLMASLGARVSLSPGEAQISLEAAGSGDLSLYLRVRDGRTDVRVEGAAAHLVDTRIPELKAALSQEGLSLGSFQSGGGASHHGRGDTAETDRSSSAVVGAGTPPAMTTLRETTKAMTQTDPKKRRLHVTA
jgi:hypothetical protein